MTVLFDHVARRARARARLTELGADAFVTSHLPNVRWLTGFTGSNATVLLTPVAQGDLLLTDGRYDEQAATEVPDLARHIARSGVVELVVDHAVAQGAGRLAFEGDHVAWNVGQALAGAAGDRVALVAVVGLVEQLRAIKDAAELAHLRRACATTVVAFEALLEAVEPGKTERDVAVWLERTMVDLGADAPSFESIVATGPNSAVPHHRPSDRVLRRGDLVKLDFGALVAGYHADMTRTVAIGDPGETARAVHALVLEAQTAGVAAAVAGATIGAVDAACRDRIASAGHAQHFTHPSGHGVGLDIHEWPILVEGGAASLAAAMAVTVEPGVYLPGIGGVRIEDTVVVREDGPPEVLTPAAHELIVL